MLHLAGIINYPNILVLIKPELKYSCFCKISNCMEKSYKTRL